MNFKAKLCLLFALAAAVEMKKSSDE